ncbi:MAG: M48 family metallopeptidase [Flammeovirgaceae bacterium]
MNAQSILYVILTIVTAEFILERVLAYYNAKNWDSKLPQELQGIYDEEKYQKSQEYAAAKEKISWISSSINFVVSILMLLLGGFGWLESFVSQYTDSVLWSTLAFFAIIGFVSDIIGTPFELYSIFVIEEKFGFNKMSLGTYIADKLKGWVLGAILGGLLLSASIWFYESFREFFWLYAWVIFMVFSLLMMMFYTNLIVPLFNKLTPLQDGELRKAIEDYASKVKFPLKNIMVVDGSKRSTKANAYFSGLGGTKNIVLYDTLIEKHSIPELVAVLAHEVGHYKKKHTLQALLVSALTMLFTLYLLGLVIDSPLLSQALGSETPKLALGMVAFSILYSPISTITGLIMNILSRKNEFEADAYAAQTSSANELITALKKLSVDTLSNLKPHPAYVFFYYSHPPLLQRMSALKEREKKNK